MVKLALYLKAELGGVTNFSPVDTASDPFLYTFKIICNSCHEVHDSWITIQRNEKAPISGSRGEANFVWKCKNCKRESSANILTTPIPYTVEMSGRPAKIIEFECRGCEFTQFDPTGYFQCEGTEGNTKFDKIEITDLSWYDYDENEASEVSITDMVFTIQR